MNCGNGASSAKSSRRQGTIPRHPQQELRTPLQAVVGASRLLAARSRPGERADAIETLDATSKSLLTLIDGVLSYSRLESGVVAPTLHSFALAECVEEALWVSRAALTRSEVA